MVKQEHCGHTTLAIWVSSFIPVLRLLSHGVQILHLITDKRPKMFLSSNSHLIF